MRYDYRVVIHSVARGKYMGFQSTALMLYYDSNHLLLATSKHSILSYIYETNIEKRSLLLLVTFEALKTQCNIIITCQIIDRSSFSVDVLVFPCCSRSSARAYSRYCKLNFNLVVRNPSWQNLLVSPDQKHHATNHIPVTNLQITWTEMKVCGDENAGKTPCIKDV